MLLAFAFAVAPKMAMETKSDLQQLAGKLNPTIGYFEPLGLVDGNFWGETDSATIGFLREAEIKNRVDIPDKHRMRYYHIHPISED